MCTKIREKISKFFSEAEIESLARESGFVQRQGNLTGHCFLLLSMFDHQSHNRTSLNGLCICLRDYGITISKQSLHTRFNSSAVDFLRLIAEKLLTLKLAPIASSIKGLEFFNRVLVLDSTSFQLPAHYASTYKGTGGDASPSAIKIHLSYNLKATGEMDFEIRSGGTSDRQNTIMNKDIQPGDLRLEDLGYCKFERLKHIDTTGAFYLSRLAANIKIYQQKKGKIEELNIGRIIKSMRSGEIQQYEVMVGASDRLSTRLILEKLPADVRANKIRRYKRTQRRKGKKILYKSQLFKTVNAYITNVPADILPKETVKKLYALRWQIEVIFKTWKSFYHINKIKDTKLHRFQSFIYGKLILILLHMKIYQAFKQWLWNNRSIELSEIKAFQVLIAHTHQLKNLLRHHKGNYIDFFEMIFDILQQWCRKERRAKKEIPMDVIHRYFP